MRVRTSVVVIHQNKILTFHAIDPHDAREFYFLPGGLIEDHETAPQAAQRETLEETGFSINVDVDSAIDREYKFYWNGKDYDCLTLFYIGYLTSPMARAVKDADYNKGVVWHDLSTAEKIFSYSEEIQSAVKELIEKHKFNHQSV